MREIYCKVNETPQMNKPEWEPQNPYYFPKEKAHEQVTAKILLRQGFNEGGEAYTNALIEWLFESCLGHDANPHGSIHRYNCHICMQELRESCCCRVWSVK